MDAEQHARVWRKAAQVIGAMDTVSIKAQYASALSQASGSGNYFSSVSETPEEISMSRAYGAAARVLEEIAKTYEQAAQSAQPGKDA